MATNPDLVLYSIVDGVGNWKLILGIFEGIEFPITLGKINPRKRIKVQVELHGVRLLNRRKDRFTICGFLRNAGDIFEGSSDFGWFEAKYDCRERSGTLLVNKQGGDARITHDEKITML